MAKRKIEKPPFIKKLERYVFLRDIRSADKNYTGHGRRLPMNEGFIDREGNIVRPNKVDYEAAQRRKYNAQHDGAIALNKQYDSLISKYGKGSEKVYKFEREELGMHRKRKSRGLEGMFAIIGLIGGIFFLSSNITGNVIGLNQSAGNILGTVLLCVGIVGSFFWFRSLKIVKKNK